MKNIILQVVQHLRPGGIETMALELTQQLNEHNQVHILSLEGDMNEAIKDWPRLRAVKHQLHFLNKGPGIKTSMVLKIYNLMKKLRITAVHTHHLGPLLYAGLAAKLARLQRHVHTEHDAWHLTSSKSHQLQQYLLGLLKPTLVADCEAVANELVSFFPEIKPIVILNGINTDVFLPACDEQKRAQRQKLGLPIDGFYVGCAARLEDVKNHEMLLKVMSCTRLDISLVLAGDGTLKESLISLSKSLGIDNRVYFLGNQDDILPFYQSIDLFCLPSKNEGLPLSPLEAQSCNVPVILSDVGGCSSIVCPYTGELIERNNPVLLQHAILRQFNRKEITKPRQFILQVGNLVNTAKAYSRLLRIT